MSERGSVHTHILHLIENTQLKTISILITIRLAGHKFASEETVLDYRVIFLGAFSSDQIVYLGCGECPHPSLFHPPSSLFRFSSRGIAW